MSNKAKSPLHAAGMHLAGVRRMGTPEQIKNAEHALAALWLEKKIDEAIAVDLDAATRRRLAKHLVAGAPQ